MNAIAANRQVFLNRQAKGDFPADLFAMRSAVLPEPGDGQVLVRNLVLSMEPGLAGAITGDDYLVPSVPVGSVLPGYTVGIVEESRSPRFRRGDAIHCSGGWQDYAVVDAAEGDGPLFPYAVDLARQPAETWLSALGTSAFTAYIGIVLTAKPQPGETVAVSAAAGAVGSMAGLYARLAGARAVGIAGGPDKCAYLTDTLGFDAAADHRQELGAQLDATCPKGIDVYFENVGGAVLEAVWPRMNTFGRIALCGQIAQYGLAERPRGPNLFEATIKRLTLTGIMGLDARHAPFFTRFQDETLAALDAGMIAARHDVIDGLENADAAWRGLFSGANFGKRILRIAPSPG